MNTPAIGTTVTVGPFTWELVRSQDETWLLTNFDHTHWVIKNYGGTPGPGFSGWKLVSGGPFDAAGSYASREEAMAGVVPWLVKHTREDLNEKLGKIKEQQAHFEALLRKVTP